MSVEEVEAKIKEFLLPLIKEREPIVGKIGNIATDVDLEIG